MSLLEYILLAASSLFVIVDPMGAVPAFIAMTPNDTPAERSHMAKVACAMLSAMLLVFAFAGMAIFKYLGITMPAFQVAGSIVLLMMAMDMLMAKRSPVRETSEETEAGAEKTDIAITPLGVPLLAGPGAISTVILMQSQTGGDLWKNVALCGCVVAVALVAYIILRMAAHGASWLNPIAIKISTRIMGLLLMAMAIQFLANGVRDLKLWGAG
jgi:multiple antibiotic resistance protein